MSSSLPSPAAAILIGNGHEQVELSVIDQASQQDFRPPSKIVEKSRLLIEPRVTLKAIGRWWSFYINPDLPCQDVTGHTIHDPRDFYALERTHLAYVRTCNALAHVGVVVAQLFVLKQGGDVYGRALAVCILALAILLAIASAVRVLRNQDRIINGRIGTNSRLHLASTGLLMALLVGLLVVNQMR